MSLFDIVFFCFRCVKRNLLFGWRFKKQRSGGSDVALDAAGKSHWAKHLQPKYCQESCGQRGNKIANSVVKLQTCPYHPWGCYIYHYIFTYIYHKNEPNVGKYTIHGWYGMFCFHPETWGIWSSLTSILIFQIGLKRQTEENAGSQDFCWRGMGV